MSMTIPGIGAITVHYGEYTSPDILQIYTQQMAQIKAILNKPNITASDYDSLLVAINQLGTLGTNGIKETTSSGSYMGFMTGGMGSNFLQVMNSLQLVGIPAKPPLTNSPADQAKKVVLLQDWQSLAGFGVEQMLTNALKYAVSLQQTVDPAVIDPATGQLQVVALPISQTMQSMVEIDYVKTGNDVLATQLGSMQSALNITKNILNTLNLLRNISNQVSLNSSALTPPANLIPSANETAQVLQRVWVDRITGQRVSGPTGGGFTHPVSPSTGYVTVKVADDPSAFAIIYKSRASAYFKQLSVIANLQANTAAQIYQAKMDLSGELRLLQLSNPAQITTSESALASYVFTVIKDISAAFSGISTHISDVALQLQQHPDTFAATFRSAALNWILDGANIPPGTATAAKAGTIQSNLQLAVSNTENLNDTQKNTVQRYLYLFQQFYKSASSMLQELNKAILEINKGIAGRK